MILRRQILLKAIVTERLKEELTADVQAAIQQVEASQDDLDRQSRRLMLELQRTDLNRAMQFRAQLDMERRRHEETKAELQEQLKAYQELQLGEEISRGLLEGEVDVKTGDNIVEKLAQAEILVKDDVIIEIRDPAPRREVKLQLARA